MEFTVRRRRALSTVLALLLAVESVSAVAAAAQVAGSPTGTGPTDTASRHTLPAAAPIGDVLAENGMPAPAMALPGAITGPSIADRAMDAVPPAPALARTTAAAPVAAVPDRAARSAAPTLKPPPAPKAPAASHARATPGAKTYKGRNHVWIPSLGINRSVSRFPCDRQRPPDNYVYRWGCAGANNVYLLGHAYSVFKPLHDAYVRGRLKVGLKAYYADAKGTVHLYKVKWWKVTPPTTGASWAWAAQSVPSMTLQTCVGKNGENRLMVRLVEVR